MTENIKLELNILPYDDIVTMRKDGYVVIIVKESSIKKWTIGLAWRLLKLVKGLR